MRSREFKDAIFEQFARVAAAFSSPKRVEIIDLLAQSERSVESLAEAANMTVGNTSRHLQILRSAGLVASRRDGLHTLYRIADESVIDGYRGIRALAESRITEVRQLSEAFFSAVDGVEPIDLAGLVDRVDKHDFVMVDVRPRLEFEAGHLPGALNIPLEELSQRMAELDPNTTIVAYCRGPYCVLAAQAVAKLRKHGLRAQRLNGGPPDWRAAGLALSVGADK